MLLAVDIGARLTFEIRCRRHRAHAVQPHWGMLSDFPTIASHDLETVSGGFDLSSLMNLNFGQIGQSIGGLIDSFSGGSGKGAQMGGQIGSLIQQFMGMFSGGGQQQAGAPQAGAPQAGAPQQQAAAPQQMMG